MTGTGMSTVKKKCSWQNLKASGHNWKNKIEKKNLLTEVVEISRLNNLINNQPLQLFKRFQHTSN